MRSHSGLSARSSRQAKGSRITNASAQRRKLSVSGGTSGATIRPTTALPAQSSGAVARRRAGERLRRWFMGRMQPRTLAHAPVTLPRRQRPNRGRMRGHFRNGKQETHVSKAVLIRQHGGPEQMEFVDVQVGDPGPGEIRIRHKAIGLNFIDVYQRSGLYPNAMPLMLGMEGSGIVEAVGPGVTHLKQGDRAAYASHPPGSYSEVRVMPAKNVCRLPDAISFETGAAMMLKGLTAQYLLKRTSLGQLQKGDQVLFHAAAGGVGLIAVQWGKALGYEMIGTAGSEEKCKLAKEHGAAH